MTDETGEVTRLLRAWSDGDEAARNRAVEILYDDLKRLAVARLDGYRADQTLQPTSLVHAAFEKLVDARRLDITDRGHFIALSARIMRQVLVDSVRRRNTAKRARDKQVTLHTHLGAHDEELVDLLALDDALERLASHHPDRAQLVELRYFGGLTIQETAAVTGRSVATINREWRAARAWLYLQLRDSK